MCRNETPRNLAMQNIAQNYLVYIWHQFYNLFIKPIYIYEQHPLYDRSNFNHPLAIWIFHVQRRISDSHLARYCRDRNTSACHQGR